MGDPNQIIPMIHLILQKTLERNIPKHCIVAISRPGGCDFNFLIYSFVFRLSIQSESDFCNEKTKNIKNLHLSSTSQC